MSTRDLRELAASWQTPFRESTWISLKSRGEPREVNNGELVVVGPTLADDIDPRIAVLVAYHENGRGGEGSDSPVGHIDWSLSVRPPPDDSPPEDIIRTNEIIGGRTGLQSLLASEGARVCSLHFVVDVDESRYRCRVIPQDVSLDSSMSLGHTVRLEQVGYRFGNGVNGLDEVVIVYFHVERKFRVTARARGLLRIENPTWLPLASEIETLVVNAFFSPLPTTLDSGR